MKISILLISLLVLSSCNQGPTSAESFLEQYINYRFSKGQTKDKLREYTADPLQSKIMSLDDVNMDKMLSMEKYRYRKMRIVNSNCQENETCYITFTIHYEMFATKDKKDKEFSTQVKKIAEIKKIDGSWKVSDVNNIKTFHKSLKDITP